MVRLPIAAGGAHEDIWGFAVATAEEGEALRKGGITKPILILGYTFPEYDAQIVQENLRPAVFFSDTCKTAV